MPSSPETHARYMREVWYPANKQKHMALVRANQRRLREFVEAEKKRRGSCERCGFDAHPAALDFHHRDPSCKTVEISRIAKKGWGTERLLLEMEKCELICANCHRVLHAEERSVTLKAAL